MLRAVFEAAVQSAMEMGLNAQSRVQDMYGSATRYIESEKFESDLDLFAKEVGADSLHINDPDRRLRLRAKVKVIVSKCARNAFVDNPLAGVMVAVLPGKAILKRATIIFGSVYAAYLMMIAIRIVMRDE